MKNQPCDPREASGGCVVAELETAATESSAQVFDCWNAIGVSGNGSCRELLRYTHCRNCPVYSAAAAQLLDRPVMPQWRDEWTEHFAKAKKLTTPVRTSVVIFRIGAEWLALPTPAFQEVAERRVIHTLPHRRHGVVLGLVNIRGELLICVSLGRLLGLTESKTQSPVSTVRSLNSSASVPRTPATLDFRLQTLDFRLSERLLVTNWEGNRLVFPVHEVLGIRRVQNDELREPPSPCSDVLKAAFRCPIPHRHDRKPEAEGAQELCLSSCHNQTVGLLHADVLFATVNRNLQATSQPQALLDARGKNAGGEHQQGLAEAT